MGVAARYSEERRGLQAQLDSTNAEVRELLRTTARSGGSAQDTARLRELRQQARQLEDDIAVATGLEREGGLVDAEEAARVRQLQVLETVSEAEQGLLTYVEGLRDMDRALDELGELVRTLPPVFRASVQAVMGELASDRQREQLANFSDHSADLRVFVQRRIDEVFGKFQPGVERGFRIEEHVSTRLTRFIDLARQMAIAIGADA